MTTENKNMLSLVPTSTGSLEAYISSVNSIPMLTADEERELGERLQDSGDLSAAKKLIMSHLRFVVHVARGYSGYGLPQADLIQEGNVGLMKAVKRFDPTFGVRLVSFAVHWIKAEIHEYVLRNWRIVRVATTKAQRKLFFNLRSSKSRLGWFSNEEVETVAKELGVTTRDVLEMETRMSAQDAAFDLSPSDDADEGVTYTPSQYLQAENSDVAESIEQEDWEEHSNVRLERAIKELDTRSQHIIQARWLNEDKATLQDLADHYKISAERVRQIEANAMKKLQAFMH